MIHLALDWLDSPAADWLWWLAVGVILGAVLFHQLVDRGRSPLAGWILLACAVTGCASTAPSAPALSGWVYYLPASPQTLIFGASSRTICEAMREKTIETTPHVQPTPCAAVRVTTD